MATKQFLSLEGLTTYDGLIKQYIATEDAKSIKSITVVGNTVNFFKTADASGTAAYTVNLPDVSGFMEKIANAKGGKVVVSNSDGSVSEGSIDADDIAILSGSDFVEGRIVVIGTSEGSLSESSFEIGARDNQDYAVITGYSIGSKGSLLMVSDGEVDVTEALDSNNNPITVSDLVTKAFVGSIPQGSSATTVVGYVDEVAGSITTASDVTLVEAQTPTTGYLKTYELYQGGNAAANLVGKIDIPKDLVVTSGEIVVNPTGQPAGTYLKLTIANQTTPVYINVADLCDAYTAASGATQVQLAISNTNEISATLVAGGVGTTELANSAVTTAKINNGAVTTAKIADYAVTTAKIAEYAVTTNEIADSAVTSGKISIPPYTVKGYTGYEGDADGVLEIEVTTQNGEVNAVNASMSYLALYNKISDSVGTTINNAVENLDATVSQSAGNDGLALQVVEADGVLTSVTGSIAANTYDAYGAAATAESNANTYTDNATAAISTASIEALFE